ncbi:MAG: hypothetical protein AABY22_10965, partial [Nanoarchaeota archaeon]
FISDHYQEFLEIWQMQNKVVSVSEVFTKMNQECVGKVFNDEEHIKNTFKLTSKNLIKEKFSQNNGKSTNKTADTISNAHTILERRGIDPNKFIQQTNNG